MGLFSPREEIKDALTLRTERLLLRVVRVHSAVEVTDYLVRNRAFHKPFHQPHTDRYFTVEEQKLYIQSDLRAYETGAGFPFWISKKTEPNRIIGRVSFYDVLRGALLSCHVGYHMDVSEVDKGYMKEALRAGIDYMFQKQRLHRIQADVMPGNLPSMSTVESCGFRLQGLNEKYMNIDGVWRDHLCYAILNEEVE